MLEQRCDQNVNLLRGYYHCLLGTFQSQPGKIHPMQFSLIHSHKTYVRHESPVIAIMTWAANSLIMLPIDLAQINQIKETV